MYDERRALGGQLSVSHSPCGEDANFLLGKQQALRLDQIISHRWNVLRCSAMTGENLKEGLAWVVEDAKARLFLY